MQNFFSFWSTLSSSAESTSSSNGDAIVSVSLNTDVDAASHVNNIMDAVEFQQGSLSTLNQTRTLNDEDLISLKKLLNLWGDLDIQNAIIHVSNNYLLSPFKDTGYVQANIGMCERRISVGGYEQIIQRPNHGLAHTVRGAFLIPIVAAAYATSTTCSSKIKSGMKALFEKPNELKKIIIAYLFSVVGRNNEYGFDDSMNEYIANLERSKDAFIVYAEEKLPKLFKNYLSRSAYAETIRYFGDPNSVNVKHLLFRQCHRLDLLRCFKYREFYDQVIKGLDGDNHSLAKDLGDPLAEALKLYSLELLKATGNGVTGLESCYLKFDDERFLLASTVPEACVDFLMSAPIPTPIIDGILLFINHYQKTEVGEEQLKVKVGKNTR